MTRPLHSQALADSTRSCLSSTGELGWNRLAIEPNDIGAIEAKRLEHALARLGMPRVGEVLDPARRERTSSMHSAVVPAGTMTSRGCSCC